VQPETKGFENPFQISPTPCKNNSKPTQRQRGTIHEWICALKYKKKKKLKEKWGWVVSGFEGKMGEKEKWGAGGGAWWGRRAGGDV
jgi:hypothetical protein